MVWSVPAPGGAEITGYTVTALKKGIPEATKTLGPESTSHTFGQLANRATYTFEVVAQSAAGPSAAGARTATTFVPTRYTRLRLRVSCAGFTAVNPNPYPVSVRWRIGGLVGHDVAPSGSNVLLGAPMSPNKLQLFAGRGALQDAEVGRRC